MSFAADFDDETHPVESLDDLTAGYSQLAERVEALESTLTARAPAPGAGSGEQLELAYSCLADWVEEWWVWHVVREYEHGSRWAWCARWWAHAEAVSRLRGLWHLWEAQRDEWGGLQVWWAHADGQIPVLLGADGPFRHCKGTQRHRTEEPLEVESPPESSAVWRHEGDG